MIAVTGATGQLGRLVLDSLAKEIGADNVIAAVRTPSKAEDLVAKGFQVREADYARPETLNTAFAGVEKVLLISSSEVGQRVAQHQAVIDAAKEQNVQLIAYTSILRASESPMLLAKEHADTEKALADSGVPYVLLRNGWYIENYTATAPQAIGLGAVFGSAGDGKFSAASRQDLADAAAKVLTLENQAGKIYELAGDEAFTLSELAAEISALSGKTIPYTNMPQADYVGALIGAGLPQPFAEILADSDAKAAEGSLYSDSKDLSNLIGRPTAKMADILKTVF